HRLGDVRLCGVEAEGLGGLDAGPQIDAVVAEAERGDAFGERRRRRRVEKAYDHAFGQKSVGVRKGCGRQVAAVEALDGKLAKLCRSLPKHHEKALRSLSRSGGW